MSSARLRQGWRSSAQATAIAVALCFGAGLSSLGAFVVAASATTERDFTEDDVKAASEKVIDERTKDDAFVFRDPKLNADLHLVFEQVKIVRGMEGYGWFANTIFHDKDEAKKQYAIDFWFKPEGQDLKLMDIRVQKGPKQEGDGWVMITRMPVAWWWLPVQEHPGDMEVTRAWQVMSAIHGYIATHKDKDGNVPIKDDKTGETLPLEFVEIHQPVRHMKKENEYFACTDFRKPESQDEYYDIDFWVNQKSGKLEVDNVKVHKVPVQEDGVWTQVPRYTFDKRTLAETFAPETPLAEESTQMGVTKAVKTGVAKRSRDSVFSLENSRTGTDFDLACGAAGRRFVARIPACLHNNAVPDDYHRDFGTCLMGSSV